MSGGDVIFDCDEIRSLLRGEEQSASDDKLIQWLTTQDMSWSLTAEDNEVKSARDMTRQSRWKTNETSIGNGDIGLHSNEVLSLITEHSWKQHGNLRDIAVLGVYYFQKNYWNIMRCPGWESALKVTVAHQSLKSE